MKRLLIIFLLFNLGGCASTLKDKVVFEHHDNTVKVDNLNMQATLADNYTFVRDVAFDGYRAYSNTPGGETNRFKEAIYKDNNSNNFIVFMKKSCTNCFFTPESISTNSIDSIKVDNNRYYLRNTKFELQSGSNGGVLANVVFDSMKGAKKTQSFCGQKYTTINYNHLYNIMEFSPCGQQDVGIKNVVSFSKLN
ncbi:hypothetical protein [Vibrio rarus]|uniref:hypothetical protein n=1 Tax=Vibrio rarus TaxID=413403 RepID=UPI0021C312B0|nr:hypothetical protein [Vibrio rarus]